MLLFFFLSRFMTTIYTFIQQQREMKNRSIEAIVESSCHRLHVLLVDAHEFGDEGFEMEDLLRTLPKAMLVFGCRLRDASFEEIVAIRQQFVQKALGERCSSENFLETTRTTLKITSAGMQ